MNEIGPDPRQQTGQAPRETGIDITTHRYIMHREAKLTSRARYVTVRRTDQRTAMTTGAKPEHQQQDLAGTAVKMAAGFHVYDMDDSTL